MRMTRVVGLTAIVALLLSAWSLAGCAVGATQGSGNVITESRSVSNFDHIASALASGKIPAVATIEQTGEESVTIEIDDNLTQYIETEVRDGTLYISVKEDTSISPTKFKLLVTVKDLTGVTVTGSGDIECGSIETDRFDIDASGSGFFSMDSLTAEALNVKINGSGDVGVAGGEVSEQDVDISGSGDYNAGKLRTETLKLTSSGSGGTKVWATESLDARLSGSGSLSYYGNPTTNFSVTGSGKTYSLGEK